MKITFGRHLDGQRSWRRGNLLGSAIVGPQGFLGLLETFLGLPKPIVPEGERILQYRKLLADLDGQERFYHRSFQADQYQVAGTLLNWRDTWHLNGWHGTFAPDAPQRLRDMAEIEAAAKDAISPGTGERLKRVAEALENRAHPIESVQLLEPAANFAPAWQAVFSRLPVELPEDSPPATTVTNLSRLQHYLTAPADINIPWTDDNSILVVRSRSGIAAAGLLAGLCNRQPEATLLIAETDGALYDTLAGARGNARLGLSEKSALRPPLQLLSLAFALAWKPLDVYALLDFLAHPMSPLPRFASGMLAEAVAAQPGMGGEKWQIATENIRKIAGENADAVMESIAAWLQPPGIPAGEAAPIELLEEIATRVAGAFRSRLGHEDYFSVRAQHSGNAQCTQVARALGLLKKQGVTAVSRLELDQLFEQAVAHGESSAASRAEVGGCLVATHPAAAIEAQDYVIWWNLAAPALPSNYPWHRHEIAALRASGVNLPEMSDVMEADARHWLSPILAARKQLVLALPPDGEEVHPVWLAIERAFVKHSIPVRTVEDVLENRLGLTDTVPLPVRPLPAKMRWWQIGDGMIPDLKKHSFTSLDKLINNPMDWVLRYPAGINPPNILSVSGGNKLLGSLAHRAVELLHEEKDVLQWPPGQTAAWVDNRLQQLLEEEGAVLLMPGQRATLEEFRQKLLPAVSELHRQLQSAGVVLVEPEKKLTGSFFMGELTGYIDILATRSDGQSAVLDMKWSRGKDFLAKLQANKHLQLAIYSEAVRQATGKWAVPAYFILTESRLLAHDKSFFPAARATAAPIEGGSAILWQQAQETLRWRAQQIAGGRIELVIAGTEPDDDSAAPDGSLAVEEPSKWAGDYDRLAGWGADA